MNMSVVSSLSCQTMDSDSDEFESADEEFVPEQQNKAETIPVEKLSIEEDNRQKLENNTSSSTNQNNVNSAVQKQRIKPKRERIQRVKENKPKLGTKIVTNKNEAFWEAFREAKKNEYVDVPEREECWEEYDEDNEDQSNLYSEKTSVNKNFWENEKDYMELPQEESTKNQNSWSNWGTWGVSSLLSTAQLGVSTITNSVSQGISTVLETGIGVPDPEELAKLDKESMKQQIDCEDSSKNIKNQTTQRGFGISDLVSGVTQITKLVETTGNKVLTGGLDTLEVIGKKTMEVLQEGDPGLKKKRALFQIDQNKPILSHILREAKEKAELEDSIAVEEDFVKRPHYETIFDDYQGLVHLEALEMLSKQCDIKLETLMDELRGSKLQDLQETMTQIKELCELPEDEEENITDIEIAKDRIQNAIAEINIPISFESFFDSYRQIDLFLMRNESDGTEMNVGEVHQKAIDTLAKLTAIAMEQFHKTGELLLVKERRSTVDEADSLVQLTVVLTGVVGAAAGKFSENINRATNTDNVNYFITNIFLEAANSSSYIQNAFNLLIPVLQVGAI